ncbi:hypothetical protein Ccrd_003757 [Cynara cardunculus var. scolymus]|uniref:Ubiquitin-like-conjugating enzyme ATG10 n=1 Tax=Cynara cardunculus var. scolymus TaxID=59895 RepID=A0A118JVR0_CYNCS|nr:hypothetical protein Ccrd_003757 [Cynara cardunculus var. scolymus]
MASNQATCDGSLSLIDFQIAANDFAEKWKKFNSAYPEWLWIDCSNRLGFAAHGVIDGYLSLQNVFIRRSLEEERDEGGCNDDEEPFDNATLVCIVPVMMEINIISMSYTALRTGFQCSTSMYRIPEHPYLNRPWYMLHPCGTSEWMKLLLVGVDNSMATNGTERYMISWFSVVGQVFGLKLPFEMLKSIG